MKNTISYKTSGTCSRRIDVVVDGDRIESVEFEAAARVIHRVCRS